ncbi:hypothetical protein Aoki45_38090 [Algoriphagus sp. oki45]|uniref:TVP38/TMEM64 family protein n=1 Tax=Algoriphagus sp. oki45 TaxID=3067294 RepID=UPI0027F627C6|nr:hypothetical protein Aoki45_38090 [Algoriphagus sp. oki45]
MTKKASIFKVLGRYFKTHPLSVIGWVWVSIVPAVGSFILLSRYFLLEQIELNSPGIQLLVFAGISLVLGLALLPTTLTAIAVGFFWGWIGFPALVGGYILANMIGYGLGKLLNEDFMEILYSQQPKLEREIENRLTHPSSLIFFIRLSPVIPFALSNFVFASLKIPLRKVILFGIPGMLPRTFIAFATGLIANSFLGARESMNHPLQIVIVLALLIISMWGIYRTWTKAKS